MRRYEDELRSAAFKDLNSASISAVTCTSRAVQKLGPSTKGVRLEPYQCWTRKQLVTGIRLREKA